MLLLDEVDRLRRECAETQEGRRRWFLRWVKADADASRYEQALHEIRRLALHGDAGRVSDLLARLDAIDETACAALAAGSAEGER